MKKVSLKLLCGLIAAELLGFCIVLIFTFTVTKPHMETSMLDEAVRTGQQLSEELDSLLDAMCSTASYCGSYPNLAASIHAMETGQDNVSSVLTEICANPYLDVKAVAMTDGTSWWASDYGYTDADRSAMVSPTILSLDADSPGPAVALIYTSAQRNDTLTIGMYLTSGSGRGYRLVFLFDAEPLKEIITRALSYDYTGFEIGKSYGPGFFNGGDYGQAHAILRDNPTAEDIVLKESDGYYIISQTGHSWRICGYISRSDFAARYMPGLRNALGLCLLLFALTVLATLPILNSVLRPLRSLKEDMAKAADGDLSVRMEVRSQDEIGQLGEYFNDMIGQIQTHTEDRIRMEAAEANLRQNLLQSQVNYHFLYNAMSTINALARRQDYERIVAVNTALADILQSNMVLHNDDMTCRLSEELNVVRDYWTIQQISLRGDAELMIDCPDALGDCVVPRSILQPLVENSLRHGLIDEETGMPRGHVWITAEQKDGILSLTVSDDGRGIDSDTLAALNADSEEFSSSGRHIGIANIRKRLMYLYQGAASLSIESDRGTRIYIMIPCGS